MVNSFLSRCTLTTKYMTKSARNDKLTVHAIGWNRRKHDGLHLALSNRYVKTVRKAEAESQRLENLSRELGCPENMVQQWVHDVRQWATDDSIDAKQDDQHTLQWSIEHICLGVYQKKKKQASIIIQMATRFDNCSERNWGMRKENSLKRSNNTMSKCQRRRA